MGAGWPPGGARAAGGGRAGPAVWEALSLAAGVGWEGMVVGRAQASDLRGGQRQPASNSDPSAWQGWAF